MLSKGVLSAIVMSGLSSSFLGSPDAAPTRNSELAPMEKQFAELFGGEYNNTAQLDVLRDAKVPESQRHRSVAISAQRINAPQLGRLVYYVEYRNLSDGGTIFRRRLYNLRHDPGRNQLVLGLLIPSNSVSLGNKATDPSKVAEIVEADFVDLPGCDLYLSQYGDGFRGSMEWAQCTYEPLPAMRVPHTTKRVISFTRMRFSAEQMHYSDTIYDEETEARLISFANGVLHVLNRISR